MILDDILLGCGKELEGVVIPQILFGGEGEQPSVMQGLDVAWLYPPLVELLFLKGILLIDVIDRFLESGELNRLHLATADRFFLAPSHNLTSFLVGMAGKCSPP
jgi:hypothetical protein